MTFSLLAYDQSENIWCGAAATGNLCVGGWVLHGHARAGICASQGQTPSTIWADTLLDRQANGQSAERAVANIVADDEGRAFRQLAAIDLNGGFGVHSGSENQPYCGHLAEESVIASGNILAGPDVLRAMIDAYRQTTGHLWERLVAALRAGRDSGGDRRGLQSAALLAVGPAIAPISFRIDDSSHPIEELDALLKRGLESGYRQWVETVPTELNPEAAPDTSTPDLKVASAHR